MKTSKQTVWLVSLLSLMVVLSAYYATSDQVQPATQLEQAVVGDENFKGLQLTLQEVAPDKKDAVEVSKHTTNRSLDVTSGSFRAQLSQKYVDMLTSSGVDKQQIKEAHKSFCALSHSNPAEQKLEVFLKSRGFETAVIKNGACVVVNVKGKTVPSAAVKLINLVQERLGVEPANISIKQHSI
ncbi:MAG: hypothetical protein RLZ12_230 [Bacillota bacterium]|jgi:stage III sporulation protein AH